MRITIRNLQEMKEQGEKIAMLTAYDYPTARMVDEGGVPIILVGDSVGNNVLGYRNTVPVTMDDMVHHLRAVLRGAKKAHIVCDMPFMSYQADTAEAVRNAGQFLKRGRSRSSLRVGNGLSRRFVAWSRREYRLWDTSGLRRSPSTRQAAIVCRDGTRRARRTSSRTRWRWRRRACTRSFSRPYRQSWPQTVTERVSVPTIGIGAGVHCDGQVLVFHDVFGINTGRKRKHVRKYADVGSTIIDATRRYIADVQSGSFPGDEESFFPADGRPSDA